VVAKFVFWDVQHGNACYVRTPTNKRFVVDCGTGSYVKPASKTFSPLGHLWHKWGVKRLDAAFITHPHTHHIADIENLKFFKPKKVVAARHLTEDEIRDGNSSDDEEVVDEYLACLKKHPQTISPIADDPMTLANSGMSITYYRPKECGTSNLNNHSLVLICSYAGSKVLIPGDNEAASWNELLDRPGFIASIKNTDILLAPHHGRQAGYSSELFRHINPRLVIISDGSYSDTSATDRYGKKSRGWKVWSRTTGEGEVRKCVTTRYDDYVTVELGRNKVSKKSYIKVTVD
jgi:competence protein ComEC